MKRWRTGAPSGPVAWVVDDNPRTLKQVTKLLRQRRVQVVTLSAQNEFVTALSEVPSSRTRPEIVVLDLHLPWDDQTVLGGAVGLGGMGCLSLLRQEPETQDVPVVLYSAFIEGDVSIRDELRDDRALALVNKPEVERLGVVIENLLPTAPSRAGWVVRQVGRIGEQGILRVAALIGAVTTLVAALFALVRLL